MSGPADIYQFNLPKSGRPTDATFAESWYPVVV